MQTCRPRRLLDPHGTLFAERVTSREDFPEGSVNKKNISRLFPSDDSMVVIVDDKEDVWADQTQRCVALSPVPPAMSCGGRLLTLLRVPIAMFSYAQVRSQCCPRAPVLFLANGHGEIRQAAARGDPIAGMHAVICAGILSRAWQYGCLCRIVCFLRAKFSWLLHRESKGMEALHEVNGTVWQASNF